MNIFVSYSSHNRAAVKVLVADWAARLRDDHESPGGKPELEQER